MKRMFDVIVAVIALVLLFPVFIIIAIVTLFAQGSPVLFVQIRPGLHGLPFKMFKFRTMRDACDTNGLHLPDRERITKWGNFLRNSSLDELPEIWNVLKGDMSLVGPRPLLMEYLPLYNEEQTRRHDIKPGITGWAQVNGRNALSWEEKFKLDVWYVNNQSFWVDIKILWITLKKVFMREGISADGHVTIEPFKGNSK